MISLRLIDTAGMTDDRASDSDGDRQFHLILRSHPDAGDMFGSIGLLTSK